MTRTANLAVVSLALLLGAAAMPHLTFAQEHPVVAEELLKLRASHDMKDAPKLQLYRLMLEVNVLKQPEDYTEMALIAIEEGSPGAAQQVLERGFAAKVFPDQRTQDKNKRLLDLANRDAADQQAHLPAKMREAEAAPTGAELVKVGYGFMGLKQYPQAIDAFNKALVKGGMRPEDAAGAQLNLGVAQFRAGNREQAVRDFHQVKGDPALERIANLWALQAKQPGT